MRPPGQAAIVIFGAALRADGTPTLTLARRIEAAWRHGEALDPLPLYVPTGGVGWHGPSEASSMAAALRRAGIPEARILVEDTAPDTLASVRACAALLRARGHTGPVLAATSAYHLPRCLVLLRLAGLPARAVPPPPFTASHTFLRRWRWRLREVPALPWDVGLMLVDRLLDRRLPKR